MSVYLHGHLSVGAYILPGFYLTSISSLFFSLHRLNVSVYPCVCWSVCLSVPASNGNWSSSCVWWSKNNTGWTNWRTDGHRDRQTNWRTVGRTKRQTDGRTCPLIDIRKWPIWSPSGSFSPSSSQFPFTFPCFSWALASCQRTYTFLNTHKQHSW